VHAPEWVSKELERLHPQARLGWIGQDRLSSEEPLNKGSFFLLQLYHPRDAERTLHFAWDSAGPIWGSRFDPLRRVPFIMRPLTKEEVFSGQVLQIVREMMMPLKERIYSGLEREGRELEEGLNDLCGSAGEKMYWDSKRLDHAVPLADKFISEEDRALESGENNTDLSDFCKEQAGAV